MSFQNPSQTNTGKTEDFNLQISRGHVNNHTHVHKFGWNTSVGTAFETIWDGSNVYTYHNAGVATVTVANGVDSQSNVQVVGLDQNFNPASEYLVAEGSASTTQFSRVFRAIMHSANTGTTNVGAITVRVDNTSAAVITAGGGQTQMALYTIPAGKTGYLKKIQGSIDKQKEVVFRIISKNKDNSNVFTEKGRFGTFGVPVTYEYPYPLRFSANTDIQVQAKAGATTEAGAIFDLVLIDGINQYEAGTGVD